MLLHESGTVAGISPRIRYVEVSGHRDESVRGGAIAAAIRRLDAGRVDALDRQLEELELVIVTLAGDADYRVQRHLHIRQLLGFLVEEESDDAAQHRLMRHHEHVVGSLQLGDHRLDALHRVHVALAPRVTIAQLVLIAPGEFLFVKSHRIHIRETEPCFFSRSSFGKSSQTNLRKFYYNFARQFHSSNSKTLCPRYQKFRSRILNRGELN